jgi:hypothetical protein
MTLEEAYFVSQIISSVLLIGSLLFVGTQIWQSRVQFFRSEANATQTQYSAFRALVINDPAIAKLWLDGLADPNTLNPADRFRHTMLLSEFFWATFHNFDRRRSGVKRARAWQPAGFERIIASPGGQKYWHQMRSSFDPEFRQAIDALAANEQSTPLAPSGPG